MKGLHLLGMTAAFSALLIFVAAEADAQRGGRGGGGSRGGAGVSRGGGGGGQVRASSSGSIRGTANRSASAGRGTNVNRNTNVNRANVNRGGNRVNTGNINSGDINVDVDRDYDGWGGYYNHPVAAGAAVAATTAVAMGAYYSSLPSGCVNTVRVGITYYQCGSTWYQPNYSGSNVQYVVVEAP